MAKGNARVGQPKGSRLAFDDTKQEEDHAGNPWRTHLNHVLMIQSKKKEK